MRLVHVSLLLLLLLTLTSCLGPPTQPLDYSVTSTSTTTVMITFDRPVAGETSRAANYRIEAADGTLLRVKRAYQRDAVTVLLGTAPQVPGFEYDLTIENVRAADAGALNEPTSNFIATSETAPILASAIALDPNTILLTFGTPTSNTVAVMGDSALDISNYDIVEENPTLDETPDLTIVSAEFGVDGNKVDRGRVILTTETQKDTLYTPRAVNITGNSGDKLLDPGFSSAEFRGMPEEDTNSPNVVSATSIDNTHVLIDFDEPVVGGDRADRYAIVDDIGDDLEVLEAEYANPYETQVLITTAP